MKPLNVSLFETLHSHTFIDEGTNERTKEKRDLFFCPTTYHGTMVVVEKTIHYYFWTESFFVCSFGFERTHY